MMAAKFLMNLLPLITCRYFSAKRDHFDCRFVAEAITS
jgi:hypothetical protein